MDLMDKYYDRDKIELTQSEDIVFEILNDIKGRSGLEDAFDGCDDGIKEEILQEWIDIVDKKIDK